MGGRVLVAATAAVALVAVGTTFALGQSTHRLTTLAGEGHRPGSPSGQPPLPPLQTDAGNEAAAARAADRTIRQVPTYPGAHRTSAIPGLYVNSFSGPAEYTVSRTTWWTVPGSDPRAVATWYEQHPTRGFVGSGTGRSGTGEYDVDFDEVGIQLIATGRYIVIETAATPTGVAVRVTVQSLWSPARPLASYVQDVRSIDVHSTLERDGHTVHRSSFRVTDPDQVLRVATVYDGLPGQARMALPCPFVQDAWTDRILFHTATGDVTAVSNTAACGFGLGITRDGRPVPPDVGNSRTLLRALGLDR